MNIRFLAGALIALASASAHAQVYRCTDASGKTVYSQAPCTGGTRLNDSTLRGNTVDAVRDRSAAGGDAAPAAQAAAAPKPAGVCPTELDIRNIETGASSSALRQPGMESELAFMQAEIRRARACAREGGTYSAEDWRRITDAHGSQTRQDAADRARARAEAENIHALAASPREQERLRDDRKAQAAREAQAARAAARKEARDTRGCVVLANGSQSCPTR